MAPHDPDHDEDPNARMLAEMAGMEALERDKPRGQWIPWRRPHEFAVVNFLERYYEETKNPIFVWKAIQILRTAHIDYRQYEWVDAYLGGTADNLTELLNIPPDPKKVPASIVKALGFGEKPFSTAKTWLRDLRLARAVMDRVAFGDKETEIAIPAVAENAGLSPTTVGNAWRKRKETKVKPKRKSAPQKSSKNSGDT
jgi:hypothetical protein